MSKNVQGSEPYAPNTKKYLQFPISERATRAFKILKHRTEHAFYIDGNWIRDPYVNVAAFKEAENNKLFPVKDIRTETWCIKKYLFNERVKIVKPKRSRFYIIRIQQFKWDETAAKYVEVPIPKTEYMTRMIALNNRIFNEYGLPGLLCEKQLGTANTITIEEAEPQVDWD